MSELRANYGSLGAGHSEDPRLARASQFVTHLRAHPESAKRSLDELSKEFGIGPAVVEELIRAGVATGEPRPPFTKALMASIRGFFARIGQFFDALFDKPFLCLSLTMVVAIGLSATIDYILPGAGFQTLRIAIRLTALPGMLLFHLICYFRCANFKTTAIGTGLFMLLFAGMLTLSTIASSLPTGFEGIAGRIFFLFAGTFVFSLLYGIAGAGATLLGAIVRLREERVKRMHLSRHELLARMYVLQARLQEIPERHRKPEWRPLAWVRAHPYHFAAGYAFLQSAASYCVAFGTGFNPNNPTTIPLLYMLYGIATIPMGLAAIAIVGWCLRSARQAVPAVLAFGIPEVLMAFLPLPQAPDRWTSTLGVIGTTSLVRLGALLALRLGIHLTRELNRLRLGPEADESLLIAELLEIRRRLASAPVRVFLMVVDAAGSTKMKEGGDPLAVEYTFRLYQEWISGVVKRFEGRTVASTGDGQIVTFGSAKNALKAAKTLLLEVNDFNVQKNLLQLPFRLRLALHSGEVVAEVDEVQFANVIDVAAHAEKASPVGGIAVTEPAYEALGRPGAHTMAREIDGFPIYVLTIE